MVDFKSDGKMIFLMFFGLIIASTLIVPIADEIFVQTNTFNVTNETVIAPAVNATLDLAGRTLLTSLGVLNATDGAHVPGGLLQTGFGTNGLRTVQLTLNDSASNFSGTSVNISYTFDPDGGVSGGARSLTLLILIFAALGALIFAVATLFGSGSFKNLVSRS